MKRLKLLLPVMVVAIQGLFAQTTHLKLSTAYPAAGQKVSFTYDPAGTVVNKKKNIAAVVACYLPGGKYMAADINLKLSGKLFKSEITIPINCELFFIRISADGQTDNNDGKGYIYHVYKNRQPVKGTYAAEAIMRLGGRANFVYKILPDTNLIISLYKKEQAFHPENEKQCQSQYYYLLIDRPEHKTILDAKIASLQKSSDEDDLILAQDLLLNINNVKAADSLGKAIKARFPLGVFVKNKIWNSFNRENNLAKKDSIYNMMVNKYPLNTDDDKAEVDYAKAQLALLYITKGDINSFDKYESQVQDKTNLVRNLSKLAWEWALQGKNMDMAEKIAKESVDVSTTKMNGPYIPSFASPKEMKVINRDIVDKYSDAYAFVLWKANKPTEALPFIRQAYERSKTNNAEFSEHYAEILAANGQYAKAMEVAAKSIKLGQYSVSLTDELKRDYINVKSNDKGYDEYLSRLKSFFKNEGIAALEKTMVNIVAPTFTLKDIDGKTVSLADLKGKIVVLDFWATWCVPCKASFPGMQIAVDKYKNDPDVKFVFIDTYETGDSYLNEVKKFIAENNYSFNVLVDDKDKDGKQAKVVKAYKAGSIPVKFIIDKNGHIRFRSEGYIAETEKLVEEISNMIKIVRDASL